MFDVSSISDEHTPCQHQIRRQPTQFPARHLSYSIAAIQFYTKRITGRATRAWRETLDLITAVAANLSHAKFAKYAKPCPDFPSRLLRTLRETYSLQSRRTRRGGRRGIAVEWVSGCSCYHKPAYLADWKQKPATAFPACVIWFARAVVNALTVGSAVSVKKVFTFIHAFSHDENMIAVISFQIYIKTLFDFQLRKMNFFVLTTL